MPVFYGCEIFRVSVKLMAFKTSVARITDKVMTAGICDGADAVTEELGKGLKEADFCLSGLRKRTRNLSQGC